MEISFCVLFPAFALANLCITSYGGGCARNSTTTRTCRSLIPLLTLFFSSHTPSLFLSHSTVLLCPHILLGDDANASNCILGLVIYCRSMRIIFTRLPTRSASVCVCMCAVYMCAMCVHTYAGTSNSSSSCRITQHEKK